MEGLAGVVQLAPRQPALQHLHETLKLPTNTMHVGALAMAL